jgi:hypothetical protein
MSTTLTRLTVPTLAIVAAASLAFGISERRSVQEWQAAWSQHLTDDAVETARRGAQDCTVSLSGPSESDAHDVAECVDSAIARAMLGKA